METTDILKSESFNRSAIREEVANIVRGLSCIQVKNSSLIKSTGSLEEKFEKNAKGAIDSFQSVSNLYNLTESAFIDGQGDANFEPSSESSPGNRQITIEKKNLPDSVGPNLTKQMISESPCFLQQLNKGEDDSELKLFEKPEKNFDLDVQEDISNWEENEEKFLRIIDALETEKSIFDDIVHSEEITENIAEEKSEKIVEEMVKITEGINIETVEEIRNQEISSTGENFEEINEGIEPIGEMMFLGEEPKFSSFSSKISAPICKYSKETSAKEMEPFSSLPAAEECKSKPPTLSEFLPPTSVGGSELEAEDNYNLQKSAKSKRSLGNRFRKLFHFVFSRKKQ